MNPKLDEMECISNKELVETFFSLYELKNQDDTNKIVASLVKKELIDRLDMAESLSKVNKELNKELDECEGLFGFMAGLMGISLKADATTEDLEKFATELTYQFKNLIVYREFVKAILRHLTIDEDLGVIAISILKDTQSDIESADYNYINEVSKQLSKASSEQIFESDITEVC